MQGPVGEEGRVQGSGFREQPFGESRGQRSEVREGTQAGEEGACCNREGERGREGAEVVRGTATRTGTDGHGRARTAKRGPWGEGGRSAALSTPAQGRWMGGKGAGGGRGFAVVGGRVAG